MICMKTPENNRLRQDTIKLEDFETLEAWADEVDKHSLPPERAKERKGTTVHGSICGFILRGKDGRKTAERLDHSTDGPHPQC